MTFKVYGRVGREPIVLKRLREDYLLVRPYSMPEKIGSIYTPSAMSETKALGRDNTQTLWECVWWSEGAQEWAREHIGVLFEATDIIVTGRRFAVDTFCMDEDDEPLFTISCEGAGIRAVRKWSDEDDEV